MKILPILEGIVVARIKRGNHSELHVKIPRACLNKLADEVPLAVQSPYWATPAHVLYFRISGVIVKAEDALSGPVHEAFKNIKPCS